ncbi:MAG: DoxX family protein [Betaproteobacteria bacterium]|nr:DoxX family protein [Betaproteobacteria bacterium]NBY04657.1 DoxX family protein [Betaproteobacteria bacterium]
MNDRWLHGLNVLARLLIAALFLPAGLGKLAGFQGTVGYIASVGLPLPQLAAALAVVLEVGGGVALLLGFKTRWVALALALFTLVAGVCFHAFWRAAPDQLMVQQIMFMKNLSIAGGLVALALLGAGAWSMDARRTQPA